MSRLDSMIHRLIAQRDLLNRAADLVSGVEGPVLELGLGNGRTYSHLKALFPDREVFAFDRQTVASIRSMPDAEHMILGEIRDTLPYCAPRIAGRAALVHADLSNGDPTDDLALADAGPRPARRERGRDRLRPCSGRGTLHTNAATRKRRAGTILLLHCR